ncbi:MAG: VacJ family lipoprotein [Elusimicrobia bacterium]|nr:VacJ family lipoprotein [Elusimicrobiota bacterium]
MRTLRLWPLIAVVCCAACAHGRNAPKQDGDPPPQASAPKAETPKADSEFDQFDKEFGQATARPATRDPLRGYNRFMFNVNDKFYFWVGKPLTKGYSFIIPQVARVAVGRAFINLKAPVRIVNNALTGHFKATGTELTRLLTNSTLGLGGLFDPAYSWFHIKQVEADFGQTLGHYGVGPGFPVVLPLLGPSDVRDGLGLLPENFVNPVYWVASYPDYLYTTIGGDFNYLSLHGDEYEKYKKDAVDPYTYFRDAYLEYREKRVKESRGEK